MPSLDKKDEKILLLLKKNARISLAEIAREIHLSRSATHDRIKRLESNNVIAQYTIKLGETATKKIHAFFTINFLDGYDNVQLAKTIHSVNKEVDHSYCLSGDIDNLVSVFCENFAQLSELRERISQLNGVASVSTHMILNSIE